MELCEAVHSLLLQLRRLVLAPIPGRHMLAVRWMVQGERCCRACWAACPATPGVRQGRIYLTLEHFRCRLICGNRQLCSHITVSRLRPCATKAWTLIPGCINIALQAAQLV